jgi:type II secretory pathway pseudopilin PulG
MSRLRSRRGAGLAEMIVALTLTSIVASAGVAALAGAEHYMRRARATSDARRMLREAEAVLASELRAASADSIRVRGDTAVDFAGIVGVSVACVSSGSVLVLPPDAAAGGNPYSTWRASPEAGDVVAVFDTSAGGGWLTAVVDSAGTRIDGAGCRPASGLVSAADSAARRPVTRLVLHTPAIPAAAVGAPVRVQRSGRYALTRSVDGSWSLSYRRCAASAGGTAQPVVGPFAAPADSGLVFTDVASEARLDVAIRTFSAPGTPVESAMLRVVLRNRAAGSP